MINSNPAPSPVGSTPTKKCDKCEWWAVSEKDRGTEEFRYAFLCIYDVTKARRIVKNNPHEVFEMPTDRLAMYVDYPACGFIDMLKAHIDEGHIDHTDDEPIILAMTPEPRQGEKLQQRYAIPIDGHHRIAKAIKYKHPVIKCYLLDEKESDSILTDHRRAAKVPKKKKKK